MECRYCGAEVQRDEDRHMWIDLSPADGGYGWYCSQSPFGLHHHPQPEG